MEALKQIILNLPKGLMGGLFLNGTLITLVYLLFY